MCVLVYNVRLWYSPAAPGPRIELYGGEYTMGSAHKQGPTLADIVYSIRCDASCFEDSADIDEFHANFGGEKISDTLKAFEACKLASERWSQLPELMRLRVDAVLQDY